LRRIKKPVGGTDASALMFDMNTRKEHQNGRKGCVAITDAMCLPNFGSEGKGSESGD